MSADLDFVCHNVQASLDVPEYPSSIYAACLPESVFGAFDRLFESFEDGFTQCELTAARESLIQRVIGRSSSPRGAVMDAISLLYLPLVYTGASGKVAALEYLFDVYLRHPSAGCYGLAKTRIKVNFRAAYMEQNGELKMRFFGEGDNGR